MEIRGAGSYTRVCASNRPVARGARYSKRQEANTISDWYYKQGEAVLGPISREELAEIAEAGAIESGTPVKRGEDGPWEYYELLTSPDPGGETGPPPLPTEAPCARCARTVPRSDLVTFRGVAMCPACKRDYFQHLVQGTLEKPIPLLYIKRALAKAIDVNLGFSFLLMNSMIIDLASLPEPYQILVFTGSLAGYGAYTALTTGFCGGTLGKLVFRVRVVSEEGAPIGFGQAMVRTLAAMISVMCLGLGYALALTDPARRTLHDRIAQTRVVPEGT